MPSRPEELPEHRATYVPLDVVTLTLRFVSPPDSSSSRRSLPASAGSSSRIALSWSSLSEKDMASVGAGCRQRPAQHVHHDRGGALAYVGSVAGKQQRAGFGVPVAKLHAETD